jgi:hypothetical protein
VKRRDILIYLIGGLGVWLNGAVSFRLGGRILFENGPWVTALVGVVVAALVCGVLQFTMGWRKAKAADAVTVAVLMALPGLFGETARQTVFPWATGLRPDEAAQFAAVIFFGNAVLLSFALIKARAAVGAPVS